MNIPDSITLIDILVFAVTLFLGYQIYRVLGMRTGHEKKRGSAAAPADTLFVDDSESQPANDVSRVMKEITNTEVLAGLEKIMQADPTFNPDQFVEGVKKAFDMIFRAFIKGDKPALKPLLSTKLYNEFSHSIDIREKEMRVAELSFFRLVAVEILHASLEKEKIASITVAVRNEQTVLVRKQGELIEGDPDYIDDVTDEWVFERKLSSTNPTWVLTEVAD